MASTTSTNVMPLRAISRRRLVAIAAASPCGMEVEMEIT